MKRPTIIDPCRSADELALDADVRIAAVKQARTEFQTTASIQARYADERLFVRYRAPQLERLYRATGITPAEAAA